MSDRDDECPPDDDRQGGKEERCLHCRGTGRSGHGVNCDACEGTGKEAY